MDRGAQPAPARNWHFLLVVAGLILVADQATKYRAVADLTQVFAAVNARSAGEKLRAFVGEKDLLERGLATPPVHVFANWWQLRYTQNRGAAWGFLSGAGAWFRVPFFHLVTILAIIFIIAYYRKLEANQRWLRLALALLLGGALGNGFDRVLRGYVIDFIDWHWFDQAWLQPGHHWPTFNVADCGVSVGLALLFLEMVFAKKEEPAPPARAR